MAMTPIPATLAAFKAYCRSRDETDNPLDDMAEDITCDPRFPATGDLEAMLRYIEWRASDKNIMVGCAARLWIEFIDLKDETL